MWRQSVLIEAAASKGYDVIASLYDLVKAYEAVPLENVWRAGLKLHFPLDVLRLELEAFAAMRTVIVDGACADPVHTLSALVAGASFATDCLFMVWRGRVTKFFGTPSPRALVLRRALVKDVLRSPPRVAPCI